MRSQRYVSLDAWRALAALAVVFFHCAATAIARDSFLWTLLGSGWTGVFVFFPISGYCVFAAVSRQENATVAHFVRRRWRRIVPPYWASILVTLLAAVAALPFNRGSLGALYLDVPHWISVLTLTQVFMPDGSVLNPVYWSLCYEEQFYLVVAALLLIPGRHRVAAVMAISAMAAVYVAPAWPESWRIDGIFLTFWLPFSGGIATYLWLECPRQRPHATVLLVLLAAITVLLRSPALLVSCVVSILFIALARFDRVASEWRAGRILVSLGAMSYSLYLIHVPIGGRVVNLLRRLPLPGEFVLLCGVTASIAAAWIFHSQVERRFLNTPAATTDATRKGPAFAAVA